MDELHFKKKWNGMDGAVRNVGTTIGTEETRSISCRKGVLVMLVFAICQRRTRSKLTSLVVDAALAEERTC